MQRLSIDSLFPKVRQELQVHNARNHFTVYFALSTQMPYVSYGNFLGCTVDQEYLDSC